MMLLGVTDAHIRSSLDNRLARAMRFGFADM